MKETELKFEWNWNAQMNSLILLLESGNEDGKRYAREELLKLAEKLDKYNEATNVPSSIFETKK